MIDFRPVFLAIGWMMIALSACMLVPAAADWYVYNPDWRNFVMGSALTGLFGLTLVGVYRNIPKKDIDVRQGFILTTLAWFLLSVFAAIPFRLHDAGMSWIDAFFESVSGLTTTGATVMTGLQDKAPGILLWRSILQWLGGVGIVVIAIAVMPTLKVGGMQLFHSESSDRSEKIFPKISQITGAIMGVYITLTLLCWVLLQFVGVHGFDAINHAMTTLSTGGFSTYDNSVAGLQNPSAEWIICVFMILAGIPFLMYLKAWRGDALVFFRDAQPRGYLTVILVVGLLVSIFLYMLKTYPIPLEALRHGFFNTVSLLTSTGFASANYDTWGSLAIILLLLLMFTGGCSGSSAGGIKIFRLQILAAHSETQFKKLLEPHGIFIPYYNKRPIEADVTSSVLTFFYIYIYAFGVLTVLLAMTGLDVMTAISGSVAALSNVGPGFGDIIGPAGTYAGLNDFSKIFLIFGMILGRLELFTVLVLFLPRFWKG